MASCVCAVPSQAASELTSFAWDDSAHDFVVSEAVCPELTVLLQLAALCRLVSAGPVVQCLPAAVGAPSQRLLLHLQLTVPSRSRLVGWQPAGAAAPAEAEALTLSSDVPQLDVLVLVRRSSGTYLPVTLNLLSDSQTPIAGSKTSTVSVQVSRHSMQQYYGGTMRMHAHVWLHVASARLLLTCLLCCLFVCRLRSTFSARMLLACLWRCGPRCVHGVFARSLHVCLLCGVGPSLVFFSCVRTCALPPAPVQASPADQGVSGNRPELLVAHSPVLLLTARQQQAAAELLQLVQCMGGVSAIQDLPVQSDSTTDGAGAPDGTGFVEDMGLWLSYMSDASGATQPDTQLADDMAVMGTGLLTYCVERGLAELAQLIVSAMVQRSGTANVGGEQGAPWFLAAAQPGG